VKKAAFRIHVAHRGSRETLGESAQRPCITEKRLIFLLLVCIKQGREEMIDTTKQSFAKAWNRGRRPKRRIIREER